jgi:hypothetical protein
VRHYEYGLGREVQEAAARMGQGTMAVATDHLGWRDDAAGAVEGRGHQAVGAVARARPGIQDSGGNSDDS